MNQVPSDCEAFSSQQHRVHCELISVAVRNALYYPVQTKTAQIVSHPSDDMLIGSITALETNWLPQ
jgi:hypothetical protein